MRRRGMKCEACRGTRLHELRPQSNPLSSNLMSFAWTCAVCQTPTEFLPLDCQPGVTCKACGDCRVGVARTERHRPGMVSRLRKCERCGTAFRTREVVGA